MFNRASHDLYVTDVTYRSSLYKPGGDGLYKRRGAVEREFGRLKNEWALAPLRVRRIERVRLHADLTILAKRSSALARAGAVRLVA